MSNIKLQILLLITIIASVLAVNTYFNHKIIDQNIHNQAKKDKINLILEDVDLLRHLAIDIDDEQNEYVSTPDDSTKKDIIELRKEQSTTIDHIEMQLNLQTKKEILTLLSIRKMRKQL